MTEAPDQLAQRNRRQLGATVVDTRCRYCGTSPLHPTAICPRIRTVEYDEAGDVRRVELWSLYELAEHKARAERAKARIPVEIGTEER